MKTMPRKQSKIYNGFKNLGYKPARAKELTEMYFFFTDPYNVELSNF